MTDATGSPIDANGVDSAGAATDSAAELWAVVLAGGASMRFWPLGSEARPKFLLPLAGERSLLADTVHRLTPAVPLARTLVVTGAAHAGAVRAELSELPADNLLVEPVRRDTAAAVGLACRTIAARAGDAAVLAVLPADHVIAPAEAFCAALGAAATVACAHEVIVTFGIRPRHAATGYGYLLLGAALEPAGGLAVRKVERFVEKPDARAAARYLAGGAHAWNAGLFVFRARLMQKEIRRQLPALAEGLDRLGAGASLDAVYADLPRISLDHGVMERAANVLAIEPEFSWADLGSWDAVLALANDAGGDATATGVLVQGAGAVVAVDSEGCVVRADRGVTALVGVRDLIVVRDGDRVLILKRGASEAVKRLADQLGES